MKMAISKKGRVHIGRTTEISYCDRDLAKINWSCVQVANGKLYVAHHTTKETESLFGIGLHKTVYLHKLILARKLKISYAALAQMGIITDHKNADGLDNRRSNIRAANSSQNQFNKRCRPYRGVRPLKTGRFAACVSANGQSHWLGTFETADEAKAARDKTAKHLHGKFFRE